jgi:hypothetical protein
MRVLLIVGALALSACTVAPPPEIASFEDRQVLVQLLEDGAPQTAGFGDSGWTAFEIGITPDNVAGNHRVSIAAIGNDVASGPLMVMLTCDRSGEAVILQDGRWRAPSRGSEFVDFRFEGRAPLTSVLMQIGGDVVSSRGARVVQEFHDGLQTASMLHYQVRDGVQRSAPTSHAADTFDRYAAACRALRSR